MITRMGFLRLENGVWFNLRHVKLLRVFVDASLGEYRIECLDHEENGWLADGRWDDEEDAVAAMDTFFDYFGPPQEIPNYMAFG
jgi:hypothetical protein